MVREKRYFVHAKRHNELTPHEKAGFKRRKHKGEKGQPITVRYALKKKQKERRKGLNDQ